MASARRERRIGETSEEGGSASGVMIRAGTTGERGERRFPDALANCGEGIGPDKEGTVLFVRNRLILLFIRRKSIKDFGRLRILLGIQASLQAPICPTEHFVHRK